MKRLEKIVTKVKKQPSSDRGRQVLYMSASLIKEVRAAYPETPVSRILEAFLRDLLEEKRNAA